MLRDKGIDPMYASTIAKIEAGDRAVRIDEPARIADLFEVSVDALLGRKVGTEQDLAFTMRAFLDAVRHARSQIPMIWSALQPRLIELVEFDWDERDEIVEACGRAYEALSAAAQALQEIGKGSP